MTTFFFYDAGILLGLEKNTNETFVIQNKTKHPDHNKLIIF